MPMNWKLSKYALLVFCIAMPVSQAQVQFRTIFRFNGNDGVAPQYMFLIQGTDGNFYGTTEQGGGYGAGEVFQITPAGVQTVLHRFCFQQRPPNCVDGSGPVAGLVQATDGNFYGTTSVGGTNRPPYTGGAGTVFRITPDGTLTTLYSFCAETNCADGAIPTGALVQGSDGNLYGTTLEGGANSFPGGTVFKITLDGTLTSLYSFCTLANCTDGYRPSSGGGALVEGTDGMFYGTTYMGGANQAGTVFKISSDGVQTILYNFCPQPQFGCYDGQWPDGGLAQGTDGNFYGTTEHGGTSDNGTVYRITPTGDETVFYNFCPDPMQGCEGDPLTGITLSSNGDFVGTVCCLAPAIYAINSAGKSRQWIGANNTTAGLLQGTNGLFYGMAGGKPGSIFSIDVGLLPFIKPTPIFGPVGTSVIILGTNLTSAIGATFNGTPATFNVVSASEITTSVPAGAGSGSISVSTSEGTVTSNLPFTVTQ